VAQQVAEAMARAVSSGATLSRWSEIAGLGAGSVKLFRKIVHVRDLRPREGHIGVDVCQNRSNADLENGGECPRGSLAGRRAVVISSANRLGNRRDANG
jgi:hypothetical protein